MEETTKPDWIVESLVFAVLILLPLILFWLGLISRLPALVIWAVIGIGVTWYCFFRTPKMFRFQKGE